MSDSHSAAEPAAPKDSKAESGAAKPWKAGGTRASTYSGKRSAGTAPREESTLPSGWALAAIGWALFIVFLTYFNITSNVLPYLSLIHI